MAAAGVGPGRKQVRQEELRRLMREKQRQNAGKKRIESPFAKYNSLGHLSCTLCNAPVKSELLWQTHVLGKQHRERVAELKGTKQTAAGSAASTSSHPVKRKTVDTEDTELKRVKGTGEKPHTSASGYLNDTTLYTFTKCPCQLCLELSFPECKNITKDFKRWKTFCPQILITHVKNMDFLVKA